MKESSATYFYDLRSELTGKNANLLRGFWDLCPDSVSGGMWAFTVYRKKLMLAKCRRSRMLFVLL